MLAAGILSFVFGNVANLPPPSGIPYFVFSLVGLLGYSFLEASAKARIANWATNLGALVVFVPQGEVLWVSKHLLSSVHGCEGMFLAQDDEAFAWTPQTARGTVAHKAIELSMSWRGDPAASELVDEGLARLIASEWPCRLLRGCLPRS